MGVHADNCDHYRNSLQHSDSHAGEVKTSSSHRARFSQS